MTIDRTTKTLLAVIAVSLAAIAFRPFLAPTPATAAGETRGETGGEATGPRTGWYVSGDNVGVYIFRGDYIYRFKGDLGKPISVAHIGDMPAERR